MTKMRIGILSVLLAAWPAAVHAVAVPDTGQTACYGMKSAIACPDPDEPFSGQDAQHATAQRSFTKLDAAGIELPDNATGWSMVRDDVTGLVWEVKTGKDGAADYGDLHDADNSYTWYDDNASRNGGVPGLAGDGTDTGDFTGALNAEAFGGFTDWRLPSAKELVWILDRGEAGPPYISAAYFPAVAVEYWTATTDPTGPQRCASVTLSVGMMNFPEKSAPLAAMAVRGALPAQQFRDNGDGTVSDLVTGLMWQKQSVQGISWKDALAYCRESRLAGYDDWRLPDVNELIWLADYSRSSPAIDAGFFSQTDLHHWTSTSYPSDPSRAYHVCFIRGRLEIYSKLDAGPLSHMLAVRGGITNSGPTTTTTVPGGCLVERVYGPEDPRTVQLRRFRDEVLALSVPGRACIDIYCSLSMLASTHLESPLFRKAVRSVLDAAVVVVQRSWLLRQAP